MKSLRKRSDARYSSVRSASGRMTRTNKSKNLFLSVICGTLAIMFLFVSAMSSVGSATIVAHADDSAKETLNNAAKEYGAEGTAEGFEDTYLKFDKDLSTGVDPNTFGYVLERLLSTSYINYTPQASAAAGKSVPANGLNCNVNAAGAGTLVYHNCDVPNVMTEFLQDAAFLFIPSGPQRANVETATVDNRWFGLPGNIPGGSVPVDPSLRSVKYTALELYGYNLQYTGYAGEWDHVKVLTSARSMANFGFMDNLKLSVKSVVNGIAGGVGVGLKNAAGSLSDGDIFGAIGGALSGFFSGGASATINTVLDTSDLNVINSQAWYRVGYGSTLYNARSLTQEELAAQAKAEFMNMLTQTAPEEASVPADLQGIQTLPADPKTAISSCSYKDASGGQSTYGDVSRSPGPAEADCSYMANAAYEQRQAQEDPPDGDSASYTWSIDGTQKLETLEEWKNTHSNHFSVAEKYNMQCVLDTNEANRANALASLRACWPGQWDAAANQALIDIQGNNNNDWVNEKVTPEAIAEWMNADPSRNFNAPWKRFVCVDSNGNDIRQNGRQINPYNANGEHNSACGKIRAPIQNGLFGNGYIENPTKPGYNAGVALPQNDTRNDLVDTSLFAAVLPLDSILNSVSNFGLAVAVLGTRISNTVINLTFSPVLDTLGLTDKIAGIIEGLRDSLFFPLAVLVIAISGVTILWKVGKEKNYGAQGISILLMLLTFVSGVFLMYRPHAVIKAVDEVPAMVEQAIMGSIFSFGNSDSDAVCSATGTASTPKGKDLEGNTSDFDPYAATRGLMCENWRVFAFTPYIYGQWGTGFENLYASNTSKPNKMQNTNADLVGDATVRMGGGQTVNNWGLYQLDVLSSGTSTDRNFLKPAGFVPRDFYRIVDMQAGPNNGAGADSRHLDSWSGNNGFGRAFVGLMSAAVAGIGTVTVVSFSFAKIQITLVSTVMLIFLPIMFLIGLHPTMGRGKLKQYIGTILGLMVQRVILVTLLAVMFKVIVGVGTAATGYVLIAFATSATCVMFLIYKKQIIALVDQSVGSAFGGKFGGKFGSDPGGAMLDHAPTAIRNYAQVGRSATIGLAAGAVGGFLNGRGVVKGATESAKWELESLRNIQARKGLPIGQAMGRAMNTGRDAARNANNGSAGFRGIANEIRHDTDQGYDERVGGIISKDLEELRTTGNDTDRVEPMPSSDGKLRTAKSARTNRDLSRLAEIERELNSNRLNADDLNKIDDKNLETIKSDDINSILEAQEELRWRREAGAENTDEEYNESDEYEEEETPTSRKEKKELTRNDKLLEEKNKIEKRLIEAENRSYAMSRDSRDMKKELQRLVDQAKAAIDDEHRG